MLSLIYIIEVYSLQFYICEIKGKIFFYYLKCPKDEDSTGIFDTYDAKMRKKLQNYQ